MMEATKRVLLVEDSRADAVLLQSMLADAGAVSFEFTWADRLEEALDRIRQENFDVVLLDLKLPDSRGEATLERLQETAQEIPIVILTGLEDEALAVRAIRRGAQDYLVKGTLNGRSIARAIRYAVDRKRAEQQLKRLNETLEQQVEERTSELVAQSAILKAIIDNIPVMLCFYSPSGEVRLLNGAFESLLGWTEEDFRRRSVMELCYPDPAYRQEVWEYMMQVTPGWREIRTTCKSGKELETSWANVRLADGSQIGIGIDLTEIKQAERALREEKRKLEDKNVALHEILLQMEAEKRRITNEMVTNIRDSVFPILDRLSQRAGNQSSVAMLKRTLGDIASGFGGRLAEVGSELSAREKEICRMIKGGLTSKEIADLLGISTQTVEKHRKNIRRKLGVVRSGSQLSSLLGNL